MPAGGAAHISFHGVFPHSWPPLLKRLYIYDYGFDF
jgi:hypothetical protein